MEEERHEVYERIPWETLDKKTADKSWLAYAVAGAVVVGALGYTFMQNRSVTPDPTVQTAVPAAAPQPTSAPVEVQPSVAAPVVVAEADLYAVDPERLVESAIAHAERFAIEYFSYDGSPQSTLSLESLLPSSVPKPEAPTGVQVFVDWVGFSSIEETGSLAYEVDVVVRSMVSSGEGQFTRQPTRVATIPVNIGDDGRPSVIAPPAVIEETPLPAAPLELQPLPTGILTQYQGQFVSIVGGVLASDGRWRVIAMAEGSDGVVRPVSFLSS